MVFQGGISDTFVVPAGGIQVSADVYHYSGFSQDEAQALVYGTCKFFFQNYSKVDRGYCYKDLVRDLIHILQEKSWLTSFSEHLRWSCGLGLLPTSHATQVGRYLQIPRWKLGSRVSILVDFTLSLLKHAQFCTLSTISLNSTFDRKWKQK
jgi:hypothetical protein